VTADRVTLARALATVPICIAILAGARDVALAIFILAAASDALDGWLARRTAGAGPRGALLDPLADKVLVVGTLVALAAVGTGWPVTVVAVLVGAREALVAAFRARAFARGITLPADRSAKVKTVIQMVGVALIIVGGRPWAVAGAVIVGLAFLVSIVTLRHYLAPRLA
jgi:CDP-diacylglycerol--glycerol-3-phosphate 3-phosphatidyltransferase